LFPFGQERLSALSAPLLEPGLLGPVTVWRSEAGSH